MTGDPSEETRRMSAPKLEASDDTVIIGSQREESGSYFASHRDRTKVNVGAVTDVGKCRSENQDHYAVIERRGTQHMSHCDMPLDQFLPTEDIAYFLMVADGIGGSEHGELASRMVIQKLWKLFTHSNSWVMQLHEQDPEQMKKRIEAYAHAMQVALNQYIYSGESELSMGTTMTTVYVVGLSAVIGHVGDSRAYLHRNNQLEQVTEDQTLAQKYIRLGHQEKTVRRYHRILANWFGTGIAGDPTVEIRHLDLQLGDKLLLCSDGLTKELSPAEINRILSSSETPQQQCEKLVAEALDHGGEDNVTVVIAEIAAPVDDPSQPPSE